ncbi:Aste57867_2574 [Aphanomyces stellatus]|uniref:Aste57867_2574 protein n=1 Tax=Aphanomyces stellatus TaxID=120398 RepID=A0A485KBL5_9STRA|nr:hypothetical protein As57867_002567 [Aphanomyces stellatus]VFT79770.1 Aste57867_2574 [Aphanomyces stellatus]
MDRGSAWPKQPKKTCVFDGQPFFDIKTKRPYERAFCTVNEAIDMSEEGDSFDSRAYFMRAKLHVERGSPKEAIHDMSAIIDTLTTVKEHLHCLYDSVWRESIVAGQQKKPCGNSNGF